MSSSQRRVYTWKTAVLGAAAIGSLFASATAQDVPQADQSDAKVVQQIIDVIPNGMFPDTGEENYANAVVACFAEGTDPDYVDQINRQVDEINRAILGPRYQLTSRWTGSQGNPITLTWSFAPDGLSIPSGIGEGVGPNVLFSTLDSQFSGQGGRATWINRFQQVFDRWHALTGITYQRITVGGNDWDDGASWGSSGAAGLRGDIRICAKFLDGNGGVLAYNNFPGTGTGGNMHLDSGDSWSTSTNVNRFFRNTIAHEHGHGIGLLHVCPANGTKLMEPFLNTGFDGPRHDDIRGAQRHYGDPRENDNTAATATDVSVTVPQNGTPFPPATPLVSGTNYNPCALPAIISGTNPPNSSTCSIDANGEVDFFKFTVNAGGTVNITVTPQGLNYASYAQDSACNNTTNNTNSLSMANLAVELIGTDGSTVLASASANGIGLPETITGGVLGGPGTYYIRVSEVDAPTQTQLYTLTVVYTQGGCIGASVATHPSNTTVCPGASANFSVVANGSTPISYQWRRGTTNLANGGNISGATTPTLTINPAGAGDVGTDYNCVVTNDCGSATSNNASLSLSTATSISSQSGNQTVCQGLFATFSVTAGGTGPFSYQWRRGTTNLSNGGNISGATSPTLTIAPVTPGDAGTDYNCVVTGACGSATSANRTLTVQVPPSITTHPSNQTAGVGGSASFTVVATGTAPLFYQWRRGSTDLVDGGNISGATTATLTISPVGLGDAATDYNCLVSNVCDDALSNNATLTVNTNPCTGDLDGNGIVDIQDLTTLLSNFGTPSGAGLADGDINGDGDVDLDDLTQLLANFGTTCP